MRHNIRRSVLTENHRGIVFSLYDCHAIWNGRETLNRKCHVKYFVSLETQVLKLLWRRIYWNKHKKRLRIMNRDRKHHLQYYRCLITADELDSVIHCSFTIHSRYKTSKVKTTTNIITLFADWGFYPEQEHRSSSWKKRLTCLMKCEQHVERSHFIGVFRFLIDFTLVLSCLGFIVKESLTHSLSLSLFSQSMWYLVSEVTSCVTRHERTVGR
jgi:hypothetical protein